MSLPAGTRLGPYEILAPLGAGGMGEGLEANDHVMRWSADQKSLFVSSSWFGTRVARVFRIEIASGRRELWKEFSLSDGAGISGLGASAITPDGQVLIFTYSQQLSDLCVVDGLR